MSFVKMVRLIKKNSNDIKILTIGLDNAGKTILLNSYLSIPTISISTFGYKNTRITIS